MGLEKDLLILIPQNTYGIKIDPRWPYRTVTISQSVLSRLQAAESRLDKEIHLVLTRGLESQKPLFRFIRFFLRKIGAFLFCVLYPKRVKECWEIFSDNGHDRDGTHIDISIEVAGVQLSFLRWGVFTPIAWVKQAEEKYADVLNEIKNVLIQEGFHVHRNRIEALQIHCD